MASYSHKKLKDQMLRLDAAPVEPEVFAQWTDASAHLRFLQANAPPGEIVIYGSGPFSLIQSIVVPNDALATAKKSDLLAWSCNPYTSAASYCYGGGRQNMWIDRTTTRGSEVLNAGADLVFGRTFEGWSGDGRTYFELNQKFAHLAGIHWRPEYGSYCHYDRNGDLEHVVSITTRSDREDVALVSFTWPKLEEYLVIADCSLVRMFDFTLVRRDSFAGWSPGPEEIVEQRDDLFYRRKLSGEAGYTRGVQIIRARHTPDQIDARVMAGWSGREDEQYVEFVARDWRNRTVVKISTDPAATTNYFEAAQNNLPFELSPAFFRPEVLSKYKTDREKYTLGERDIQCRAVWSLRGYDVNEAGQIHAYICDLARLPYSEQLHWLSFNEEPKAGISERALVNDFEGEFVSFMHPREEILGILTRWRDRKVEWWTLRDEDLLSRANPPLTSSKDEWGDAIMDLSKLVVEGFDLKFIRSKLDQAAIGYTPQEQSISLLEKFLRHAHSEGRSVQLAGMRGAQHIRSKVKGHAGSSEGKQLAHDAISNHGSFADHFRHVCGLIAAELEIIERAFGEAL
jgi:hypothetical protein